ncbi:hypothetical protein EDD15DRAFT_1228335 [Pisolithus albus]|nr:hypothetical protein EDD15DRAFT_1228335 [Pisolithus albus]
MTSHFVAVSHPRLGCIVLCRSRPGGVSSTRGLPAWRGSGRRNCRPVGRTENPRWGERDVAIRHVYQPTGVNINLWLINVLMVAIAHTRPWSIKALMYPFAYSLSITPLIIMVLSITQLWMRQ